MTDFIEIHWTAGSLDEARRVVRFLVKERLVACAQLVPWIESVYMWNNQLETTQESKVTLKTHQKYYTQIRDIILSNSSYEVPQVVFFSISGGNEEYLKWLEESILIQK